MYDKKFAQNLINITYEGFNNGIDYLKNKYNEAPECDNIEQVVFKIAFSLTYDEINSTNARNVVDTTAELSKSIQKSIAYNTELDIGFEPDPQCQPYLFLMCQYFDKINQWIKLFTLPDMSFDDFLKYIQND